MKRLLRLAGLLALGGLVALPAATARGAEESPYGVNAHAPGGEELRRLLDLAQAARIGWIRIDFVWGWVEPVKGTRSYDGYDEIVRAARARGIEVYASLGGTPAWATDGPVGIGVPRDVADWRAFVAETARHFRGRVKAWGIWNEPNLAEFWAGTRTQYVDVLLVPAALEIRKADPDALVCGPDLAHLTSGGANWHGWLLDVLKRAGTYLDVVAHHVYDADGNGDVTRKLDASTTFGGNPDYWDIVAPSVREVLQVAGASQPVWLTETGWASSEVGEAMQSRYLLGLYTDWFGVPGERRWVKKIFTYELIDDGSVGVPRWGLLRPDHSPKPAYSGLVTFTSVNPPWGDAAELVEAVVPPAVVPGVPAEVRVTLKNTGTATWTRDAGHALAPLGDATELSPGRVPLPGGRPVAPGGTVTFAFPLTAFREASFLPEWRLVGDGGTQFGPGVERSVTATGACAQPAAPVVTGAPAGSVAAGSVATFSFAAGVGMGAGARTRNGADTRTAPAVEAFRVRIEASSPVATLVDARVPGPAFAWRVPEGTGSLLGFRVAAVNGCGTGPFSAPASFTVAKAPAAIVVTKGQGDPWLVRKGDAAPTALLGFRNAGGETAAVRFDVSESAFAITPLSATLAPREETTLLLSARPGATATAGVNTGRVTATWSAGVVSTPVSMAVTAIDVGAVRIAVSPAQVHFLAPLADAAPVAEVVLTNPGSAPVLVVPAIEPGGAWLRVEETDLSVPIPPAGTRRVRLTADRSRRTSEDGASPVRTVLSFVAAGGGPGDRVDLPVTDAEPAPRSAAPDRGPVPSGTSSWVVPTTVRQQGAFGQTFVSSLVLGNLDDAPAPVDVYATPAGSDGVQGATRARVTVPPRGTLLLDDALAVLFGEALGAAHLEVRGAGTLAVRSVVTGTTPSGSRFSAEIPVVAAGSGTGARRAPLLLPGLKVTAAVRCNVVFAETTGRSARVALRLFDAAGRELGRGEVHVPAWGSSQLPLTTAVGISSTVPEASSLRVEPLEGEGRVVALATLVDNASASFSVVTGRPAPLDAADGAGPQAVASIVQSSGPGTFFTTELSISTGAATAAPLRLTYDYAGTSAEGAAIRGSVVKEVVLAGEGALPFAFGRNAVRTLFGLGTRTNTSGSLRIEGDGAGWVLARAAVSTPLDLSDEKRGTATAELPAVGPAAPEAIGPDGTSAVLLSGLRSWSRERVNLILTEVAGAPARVSLVLLGDGNVPRGERLVALGPFEKVQVNDLWNGPSGFALGAARADRLTLVASHAGEGAGKAVLALTTIDNEKNGTRIQLLAPPGPQPLGGPSGR